MQTAHRHGCIVIHNPQQRSFLSLQDTESLLIKHLLTNVHLPRLPMHTLSGRVWSMRKNSPPAQYSMTK